MRSSSARASTEVVRRFTRQVQPLLLRSCARAGCHTPGHNGPLVLHRAMLTNRKTTEQNLQAVLGFVDRARPQASPLLVDGSRVHGNSKRPPLAGPHVRAYHTLVDWINLVAGKTPTATPSDTKIAGGPSTGTEDQITELAASLDLNANSQWGDIPATTLAEKLNQAKGQVNNRPVPSATATMQPPRSLSPGRTSRSPNANSHDFTPYKPIDPFDPEIFNRRLQR